MQLSGDNEIISKSFVESSIALDTEHYHSLHSELINSVDEESTNQTDYFKLLFSITTGIGTGCAMMPIFNKEIRELEQFGINIHENEIAYTISTLNTMVVYSYLASKNIYYSIQKLPLLDSTEISETKEFLLTLAKVIASFTALIPLSQLWEIELHNKEVSGSEGFDKFIAWALFTSIFLTTYCGLKSYYGFKKMIVGPSEDKLKLKSIGDKCVVYGITGLALIGNEIIFLDSVESLHANHVIENDILKSFIQCFAFASALFMTSVEYNAVKNLFKEQKETVSKTQLCKGVTATIESAWFTLPFVSIAIKATETWNTFIKGAICCGVFIAHTILEAKSFLKKR